MDEKKYSAINYNDYLDLDRLLAAQHPRSLEIGGKMAHDEMLFIIVHQAYELWFKQIIHELESVHRIFSSDKIDERDIGVSVHRLNRTNDILKLGVEQISVLETMTPLDFLDFRDYLFPASGFQSFQFRVIETMLGLKDDQRITYNEKPFTSVFDEDRKEILESIQQKGTMVDLVEKWLERTPFVQDENYNFLTSYSESIEQMLINETKAIQDSPYLTDEEKAMRLEMLGSSNTYFLTVLNKEKHEALREEGELTFSYEATLAAVFISLYRDEPILRTPYKFLSSLKDIDETLTNWRNRHAQMVLRMIGKRVGTGGSAGHKYLAKTAKKHQIFADLYNISTLLIPRSQLIPLPEEMERKLGFYFQ
jgi:tryptophan 2,3-dioxygenase